MTNIQDLAIRLAQHRTQEGYTFDCERISGEVEVLQVESNEVEGFPVFVTKTNSQVLCIVYLWREAEVKQSARLAMLETMLDSSISIPLSAFARVGDQFVLYGALSVTSSFDEIVEEIVTLNENAVDVLSAMEDFLE